MTAVPVRSIEPTTKPAEKLVDRLRVLDGRPRGSLIVHEIYVSVQGESSFAGLPCVFVRLSGCPLRCRWCDTTHAFDAGEPATIAEVVARVVATGVELVEVTGGEPLAQPDSLNLISALADAGLRVLLETSGSYPIDDVDRRAIVIMDLKCPGSGEVERNRYENLDRLKPNDEIKFVVADRRDAEWMFETIRSRSLQDRRLLAAPVFNKFPPAELAEMILRSGLPIRLQLQLHKLIWEPNRRGV